MEIESLKNVIKNGNRPVLFLGSGASISSKGSSAPDITRYILQDHYHLFNISKIETMFEQDYECEASFENVLEKIYKTEADRKRVVEGYLDDLELSEGYKYLAVLLKLGCLYPIVVTTNHENLIERCIEEDELVPCKVKVCSLVQNDLIEDYIDEKPETIYILHIHGSFADYDTLSVTSKSTFVLKENCKIIMGSLFRKHGLIMCGYSFQDVDVRNLLQTVKPIGKGVYYISYTSLNKKKQTELVKMLQYHNSLNNVIENCSFDDFMINLGKDAYLAYIRNCGESDIDREYDLFDRTRCFFSTRKEKLDEMKKETDRLYEKYPLDELLALKEFVYYENDKNGEIYRLQQGIKFLENSLSYNCTFTSFDYLVKLKYYLSNEYLNLFLLGDNILEDKGKYLDEILNMGDECVKRAGTSDFEVITKFLLLMGEVLKEKAMLNENPSLQKENILKARQTLEKAIKSASGKGLENYYLGIAYRHYAVTYELESDLLNDAKEREKCIEKWKNYSLSSNDRLKEYNENTVRGYATMNIAASNVALLQLHTNKQFKKDLIDEGLEFLEYSIKLHSGMDEYRGVAWSNIHKCKLLRFKIINSIHEKQSIKALVDEMEESANIAVKNILRTDDLLGKGLAYQQLGLALNLYDEYVDNSSGIKLESSINILQKSVNMLENTGFFRGLTDSCIGLSEVLYKQWKKTGKMEYFVEAFNNLNIGFTSVCLNLHMSSKLEELYQTLRTETNKTVELI